MQPHAAREDYGATYGRSLTTIAAGIGIDLRGECPANRQQTAVISPVGELAFAGEKLVINGGVPGPIGQSLYAEIGAIQRGTKPDKYNWLVAID